RHGHGGRPERRARADRRHPGGRDGRGGQHMSSEQAGTSGGTSVGGTSPSGAPVSHTLEVPGAVLAYDVRPGTDATQAPLVLIGSPMGASGFVSLAGHFTDRNVVTYDPRGVERSRRTDGASESTP